MTTQTYRQLWRPLRNFNFESIEKEIVAYSWYEDGKRVTSERLAKDGRGSTKNPKRVSTIDSWLTTIDILEESRDGRYRVRQLTKTGRDLAMAIRYQDRDGRELYWRKIVMDSAHMVEWFENNIGIKTDAEQLRATYEAMGKAGTYVISGITALIQIFDEAGLVKLKWEGDKAKYVRISEAWQREPQLSEEISKYLERKKVLDAHNAVYVNAGRLEQLEVIQASPSRKFDFSKLIQLCNELNKCRTNDCYYAVAMLTRAVIDHVPPVFKLEEFSEIANNYSNGTKSFKRHMSNLDASLKHIAGGLLHTHIRESESLPNWTQIDFHQDLDALLEEVIRLNQIT